MIWHVREDVTEESRRAGEMLFGMVVSEIAAPSLPRCFSKTFIIHQILSDQL
tara:strand:- start:320 stop:475 length:156 start_codon:yes stop_codon:yes gene_type:complete